MQIDDNIMYYSIEDKFIEAFGKKFSEDIENVVEAINKCFGDLSRSLAQIFSDLMEFIKSIDIEEYIEQKRCRIIPIKKIKPTVFAPRKTIIPYARNRLR